MPVTAAPIPGIIAAMPLPAQSLPFYLPSLDSSRPCLRVKIIPREDAGEQREQS